jgi:hypothetical protein
VFSLDWGCINVNWQLHSIWGIVYRTSIGQLKLHGIIIACELIDELIHLKYLKRGNDNKIKINQSNLIRKWTKHPTHYKSGFDVSKP